MRDIVLKIPVPPPLILALILPLILAPQTALAAERKAPSSGEQVEVDAIKEKYWARGDTAEIGVVQNRIYTKSRRIQLGAFGGAILSDPFLNTTAVGASLGYHFNETFGVHLVAWKSFVDGSSALDEFEKFSGATANTNLTKAYYGVEGSASMLYGKLSLLGKSIIHYDMHLSLGVGATNTESGTYVTPSVGIGQRFYVSKNASIRLDYRLMVYRETIIEKVVPTKLGEVRGQRNNFTNAVSLGVDFMVNFLGGGE